jgi:two-component system sensor histidine kinase RegB
MLQVLLDFFGREARSEWVRLRTLMALRWMAIAGQVVAVLLAVLVFDLKIPVGLCFIAIAASAVFNLLSSFILPANKRLTERQTLLSLLFDVCQLAYLLFLAGGLTNPFALLMLVPVTLSASALTLGSTVIISALAIGLATVLAVISVPLQTQGGDLLTVPPLLQFGTWLALMIGVVMLAGFARRVSTEAFSMSEALSAAQTAMEREYSLTRLGGVVAAAAHEMGTPLATIKLVTAELAEELRDKPVYYEDLMLIDEQATRLKAILRDMGRTGKDDLQSKTIPFTTLVEQAAEPHMDRGKGIEFYTRGRDGSQNTGSVPFVEREPEILHGLRNLVQNAVDFAQERVWIETLWDDTRLRVIISDDGEGYPVDLLSRLGDPFIGKRSGRTTSQSQRPNYEGMGLGLFIAKTLLERRGAEIIFANGGKGSNTLGGAVVTVIFDRQKAEVAKDKLRAALGPNIPNPA